MSASVICLGVAVSLFFLVWVLSVALEDASVIDAFWGPGFVVVAWTAWSLGARGPMLLPVLVTVWGLRLGYFLGRRGIGQAEDHRYQVLRAKHGERFKWVSFGTVFMLQAVLLWFISLPVQRAAAATAIALPGIVAAGVVVWSGGLFFEAVGDAQLAKFKRDPASKGQVMDGGLWRYTRHPNYFGDFLVWWGLYLVAVGTLPGAWWTFVGPLLLSVLLIKVTGVALLEKTIATRRPGYTEYAARTSAFFPWPPRRSE